MPISMPRLGSSNLQTPAELEAAVGKRLRALRLNKAIDQQTLAERAGISVGALKRLEAGRGSTLRTLVSVLRALNREGWLETIAPVATVNPLSVTRSAEPRQRAARRKAALPKSPPAAAPLSK